MSLTGAAKAAWSAPGGELRGLGWCEAAFPCMGAALHARLSFLAGVIPDTPQIPLYGWNGEQQSLFWRQGLAVLQVGRSRVSVFMALKSLQFLQSGLRGAAVWLLRFRFGPLIRCRIVFKPVLMQLAQQGAKAAAGHGALGNHSPSGDNHLAVSDQLKPLGRWRGCVGIAAAWLACLSCGRSDMPRSDMLAAELFASWA